MADSYDQKRLEELARKYLKGTISAEEQQEFDQWFADNTAEQPATVIDLDEKSHREELLARIHAEAGIRKTRTLLPRIAAAASILLVLGAGTFLLLNKQNKSVRANDVAPYTAVAILKTGGKTIVLDTKGKGIIAQNKQNSISKTAAEELTYATGTNEVSAPVYDTIQIPAGGRPYRVNLPDGSKILLNAATSLRLPEGFNRMNNSDLELITGEHVYFDIVHNSHGALKIKAPGQLIEDIGTRFDVITYPDEEYKTVLVEGLVKVNAKALAPGQQATLLADKVNISAANIEQVLAWTNGYFRFNGEKIQIIMKQLSRWYNIEVKYEGKITNEGFYGKISRSKNISEVLKMLEKTKFVHFKIDGRRITVLSKS